MGQEPSVSRQLAASKKLAPKLVESLLKFDEHKFKHFKQITNFRYARYNAAVNLKLLPRKYVFPYEYFKNIDELNETELPPQAAFAIQLSGSEFNEADYANAINVW